MVNETRLTEKFGANGVRGDLPSFKDYIDSEAGQSELCAWQERITAQVKEDMSSRLAQLAPGANAVEHAHNVATDRYTQSSAQVCICPWARFVNFAPISTAYDEPLADAQRTAATGASERKVALVLEQGVRTDWRAARAFVKSSKLQRLSLANYQHRIELLRMYGYAVDGVPVTVFGRPLKTYLVPRFAFIRKHACALYLTLGPFYLEFA